MEGYSVTEAASVLGVPTERVWELLARGVLSGVPDGETGMRVFLQPRPAPPAVEEPRRSNGGSSGREPEAEASPFRELLSEFRNLTERYGQALLALGESRGEVASLRSRVDLLEARFDLRLPMSGPMTAQPPAAAGWGTSQPAPRPVAEPMSTEHAAEAQRDHDEAEPSPRRRRRRGQHRATDDFAEALARAEDPSPSELPGGEEAAAAFAAMREEAAQRTPDHVDATLPRELPAAEPIAIIEPEDVAEAVPQPVAEADVAAEEAPEPTAEAPAVEAEVAVEEAPEPIAEAPAVEAEVAAEEAPEPIADGAAALGVGAEAIVATVPDSIEDTQQAPTAQAEIVDDGLPLESEPEPEPMPYAEPAMEASAAEPEPQAAVEALPEPIAEEPDVRMAEAEVEPELDPAADWTGAGPAVAVEAPMDRFEPEPLAAPDEEPEESAQAEAVPAWEDVAPAEPALQGEAESERPLQAEQEGVADAEPSWDRDRYTARIEEPDWIPEERSPQTAATAPPDVEAPFADAHGLEPDSEESEVEPALPEPPWVGEAGGSTPTGEETMLWFGREPNRASPAWPTEDDSAAEMEVASTGGRVTRPRPADEPIGVRPRPPVPPVDPPDVRAEYRATLSVRPQPPNPASRAYRRLRRIFPG